MLILIQLPQIHLISRAASRITAILRNGVLRLDNTLKCILLGAFLSTSAHSQSQPIPPALNRPLAIGSRPGVHYISIESAEEKKMFWRNREEKDGFFLITADNSYGDLIRAFLRNPNVPLERGPGPYSCLLTSESDVFALARLEESQKRISYFFKSKNGDLFLLTTWDMDLSSDSIVIFLESLNSYIGNNKASIARVVSRSDLPVIWKAVWQAGSRQYELYAEEGKFINSTQSLKKAAEGIMCK